jgi:hypothetical protein
MDAVHSPMLKTADTLTLMYRVLKVNDQSAEGGGGGLCSGGIPWADRKLVGVAVVVMMPQRMISRLVEPGISLRGTKS